MTRPEVSVVIPTYNAPQLLLETLGSVFAQSFKDYEVVVINDGSTDNTQEALQSLRDPRLRIITQENGGIGAARNRGIVEAIGRYVAPLDHDDLWMPDKLLVQVQYMQRHPECVACTVPFGGTLAPEEPSFDRAAIADTNGIVHDPLKKLSLGYHFIFTSALMFDRMKASGAQYSNDRGVIEDIPFHLMLLGKGSFGVAGDRILSLHREHLGSFSRRPDYSYGGQKLLRNLQRRGAFFEAAKLDSKSLERYISMIGRYAIFQQVIGGKRWQGIKLYGSEFPRQLQQRRLAFLAGFLGLSLLPASMIRKLLAAKSSHSK